MPWNLRNRRVQSLLGLSVAGDLDGLTFYTNRHGKKVAYPISPPTSPPSLAQQIQRARFKTAQANWALLSSNEKANWEQMVNRLSICMTGQNMFISLSFRSDQPALISAIDRTGIVVTYPPQV